MSVDRFYQQTYHILNRMLDDAPQANREQLVAAYAEVLSRLFAEESHNLLNVVMEDARMRLDARLEPDPISQGIASMQTSVQDLWRSFWQR